MGHLLFFTSSNGYLAPAIARQFARPRRHESKWESPDERKQDSISSYFCSLRDTILTAIFI